MLFRCINYTASDYLKENSAIKLILWAQNKGNCQKESVHPKSHEKKNNWQTFSACSFIECSLSLLMFNQPPPLAQIKIYNGRAGGGNTARVAFQQQGGQTFKSDPKQHITLHGDLEGRLSREEHRNSAQNKIRMRGSGLFSGPQNSFWKMPQCVQRVRPLHFKIGHWCTCIISVLRVKNEELSLEWLMAQQLQWHIDYIPHLCVTPHTQGEDIVLIESQHHRLILFGRDARGHQVQP